MGKESFACAMRACSKGSLILFIDRDIKGYKPIVQMFVKNGFIILYAYHVTSGSTNKKGRKRKHRSSSSDVDDKSLFEHEKAFFAMCLIKITDDACVPSVTPACPSVLKLDN